MNDQDWYMLVVLSEEKNVTKTADRLFLSQPALTYRLHRIEEKFKSKLFIRNRNGAQLTPQGNHLVNYSKKMLKKLQETKEEIQSMENEIKGTVKLGVSSTIGRYMLPDMIKQYLSSYPEVDINVITGFSSEIKPLLLSGDIHIAIIKGENDWAEQKMLLMSESLYIVSKHSIDIKNLPKFKYIDYKTDASLKEDINSWWKSNFNEPKYTSMTVDNIETCKEMVKAGLGYTILPEICLRDEKELYLQKISKTNNELVKRKTWVCSRSSSMYFAPVRAFFEFFDNNNL